MCLGENAIYAGHKALRLENKRNSPTGRVPMLYIETVEVSCAPAPVALCHLKRKTKATLSKLLWLPNPPNKVNTL